MNTLSLAAHCFTNKHQSVSDLDCFIQLQELRFKLRVARLEISLQDHLIDCIKKTLVTWFLRHSRGK